MAGNLDLNITAKLHDKVTKPMNKVKGNVQKSMGAIAGSVLKVTAAVYSLKKAFDLAEMGAVAEQIEKSFANMARSVGVDAENLKTQLMAVTQETINFSNVASQVSALLAQGLNAEQIVALMRQARAEAKLFGKTTEEAFKSIAGAVTGGYTVTLKRNFGLMVDIGQATENYAKKLGKTKEEVRSFYLAQAVANEILKKSKSHLEAVNLEVMSNYEKIQRLKAQWTSFLEATGQVLLKLFGGVQAFFMTLATGLINVFRALHKPVVLFAKAVERLLDVMSHLPKVGKFFGFLRDKVRGVREELELTQSALAIAAQRAGTKATFQWSLTVRTKEQTENIQAFADALKNQVGSALDTVKTKTKEVKDTGKETFNALAEAAKSAASRIQGAFDDFFFDVFKGRIHSLKGLLTSFGDAVLRMMSNLAATKFLDITGISGLFSGIGAAQGAGHSVGMPVVPRDGLFYLHQGERVVPRYKGASGANGGVSVVVNQVIQAWDAGDVWRNRKMLAQGIAEEIKSNSGLRDVINRAR